MSKRLSEWWFSAIGKLFFMSMVKIESRLLGKYFMEPCFITQWAKSTPTLMHGYFVAYSNKTSVKEFLILLFCLSRRPSSWWLKMHWLAPVRRSICYYLYNLSLLWSFICVEKQPCLHISSYKHWEIVATFLFITAFASNYYFLK